MGLLFDFTRLINKYGSKFTAITLSCGYYNDVGDWVQEENQERVNLDGAIISFRESKVYRSEGLYTTNDKRLFTLEPLDYKLQGAKVAYNKRVYSIEDCTENAEFTGVWAYTMKYVSAFDKKWKSHDLTDVLWMLEQRLDGSLEEKEAPPPPEEITDGIEDLGERLDGVDID